jgi:hypothetical protein
LLKDVIFVGADRSIDDLVVTAFHLQGSFCMPWREFKAKYETKATAAVKESGWDLHNLEKASQWLLDHGTLEPGQLEKCRPRAKRARDSVISGKPRSAFDWS